MIWYYRLRTKLRAWRNPPYVLINIAGADRHHSVSVNSTRGMIGAYSFGSDSAAAAQAGMYGASLARIAGLRLIDARPQDGS